ncbi:MAG TPA: ABC transporter substrate-binding protein [Xanthobacteraceae bacterium]|nr:ABC transporter substrate-binding protein [Xanthobacteraceae bacterium]
MTIDRRRFMMATTSALAAVGAPKLARAQSKPKIKLGIISDLSGPNRDNSAPSLACAQQAIEDIGAKDRGLDVEVVVADHQNKPDIASVIARRWFDVDGVDCLVDVSTSNTALAVNNVAREKNKVMMVVGAATSELTGAQCSPNTVHWAYDTFMYANSSAKAMLKQGGNSWYFIAADYAFGQAMRRDATAVINANGGKVVGSVAYPFPGTSDFSSFLLQAQASGAQVLGLCQSGADTFNCIKQMKEFGVDKTMRPISLLMYANEVRRMGLDVAQGLLLTESFYWDLNDRTRAFMERVKSKTPDNWPTSASAGVYSNAYHYLKAVLDMGAAEAKADGAAAVARMKAMPTDDDAYGKGVIRADGRKMHPAYLFEAKKPSESKGSWDLLKLVGEVPAEEAFRPLDQGGCQFVKT